MEHDHNEKASQLSYLLLHERLPLGLLTVTLEIIEEGRSSLCLGKTWQMICQPQVDIQLLKQGFHHRDQEGIMILVVHCKYFRMKEAYACLACFRAALPDKLAGQSTYKQLPLIVFCTIRFMKYRR